jgi:RNA polymerase sigma-70 factor (ECF subfamily)
MGEHDRDEAAMVSPPGKLFSSIRFTPDPSSGLNDETMAQEVVMEQPQNPANPGQLDEVLALFDRYQRRLHLFILSVLPDPAAAEEVLQETNIVVWRKFDQFRPDTDFRAWVFRIAHFEVRKYLDRSRRRGLLFGPEIMDELARVYVEQESALEDRRELLPGCIEKLPAADRDLIDRVYGQGIEVAALSGETGRKGTSIYRSLRRIRQWLFDCVERRLSAGSA